MVIELRSLEASGYFKQINKTMKYTIGTIEISTMFCEPISERIVSKCQHVNKESKNVAGTHAMAIKRIGKDIIDCNIADNMVSRKTINIVPI